ncbi:acetoacetate decarboxylase family protein [Halopiger thermotolerans]
MSADPPSVFADPPRSDRDRSRVRLSTGQTVSLPLELSFAMGGVVVPARRRRLEAVLPAGLEPLTIAPGIGCVALVGIRYRQVGRGDGDDGAGLEPYDEFAVIVPAVRGARTSVPLAQVLEDEGELGGYVHWLPVTTDASVALGREIWGYPKERIALTVADGPRGIRAAVSGRGGGDGTETGDELAVRLEVPRPLIGGRRRDWTLRSYATKDGTLRRARARIRGEITIGSPVGASLSVAPELASEVGLWQRPLARLYGADVRARLEAGGPIE